MERQEKLNPESPWVDSSFHDGAWQRHVRPKLENVVAVDGRSCKTMRDVALQSNEMIGTHKTGWLQKALLSRFVTAMISRARNTRVAG